MKKIISILLITSAVVAIFNIKEVNSNYDNSINESTEVDTSKLDHTYREMIKGWREFRQIGK